MRAVRAADRLSDQRNDAVTLSEWERQGWTYHAKGNLHHSLATTGMLMLSRHLVVPLQRLSPHVDNVWLDESELAVREPRHRAFLCHGHVLTSVTANPTRRGT